MGTMTMSRRELRNPGVQVYMLLRTGLTHTPPAYYDIALRDFGLMLGALTLNRLASSGAGTDVAASSTRMRHAA